VTAIELPAGQTVALQPGQFHMMLQGLKHPLAAGERVPMTLKFEKAGDVKVELAVQGAAGASAPDAMVHRH
jgi:copper(I)-binding protein